VPQSQLIHYALSRPGGREVNEDACKYTNHKKQFCYVVADGLGGHGGGDIASQTATNATITTFRRWPSISSNSLKSIIHNADTAIRKHKETAPNLANMHTTIVVMLSNGKHAAWAHIGDSRLYHFRAGRYINRTRDHSVPQVMADAGDISERAIRYHEDRNRVLRSLGDERSLAIDSISKPCVLQRGDAFLLCTDGFWEHVLELEMEAELAKSNTPEDWIKRMVIDRLLRRAPSTYDNYTALGVFVQ